MTLKFERGRVHIEDVFRPHLDKEMAATEINVLISKNGI